MRLRTHSIFAGTYIVLYSTKVKSFMPATTKTLAVSRKKTFTSRIFVILFQFIIVFFLIFIMSHNLPFCRRNSTAYLKYSTSIFLRLRSLRVSHGLSPAVSQVSYGIGSLNCSTLIFSQIGYFFPIFFDQGLNLTFR